MTAHTALFIGDESLTRECIGQWCARGHTVSALVTASQALGEWARAEGVRVAAPDEALEGLSFDWVLSVANLRLLPEALLSRAARGAVNFHDGPLPMYAGLNAPVWALLAGERRHGITWHQMTGGVDKGEVLVQRHFDILPTDTALTLNTRCYAAGVESFGDLMTALETGAAGVSQDLSRRSYHGRHDKPDGAGVLRPDMSAEAALRLVRALDHGDYWNPLALPKLMTAQGLYAIGGAELADTTLEAGALSHKDNAVLAGFADGTLRLTNVRALGPAPARIDGPMSAPTNVEAQVLQEAAGALSRGEVAARARLGRNRQIQWPVRGATAKIAQHPLKLPKLDADQFGALARHFAETATGEAGAIACVRKVDSPIQSDWMPFGADDRLTDVLDSAGFAVDLLARAPELRDLPRPDIAVSNTSAALAGAALTLTPKALIHDTGRVTPEMAALLAARIEAGATALAEGRDMPAMPDAERSLVLDGWNATATDVDAAATMVSAFAVQVAKTPDAPALIAGHVTLSFTELDARANRVAHVLREMGAGPGQPVGLCTPRNVDLVVGALAILKAGAAYVPMDPSYPRDRLALFVEDSGAGIVVTTAALRDGLPGKAEALVLDADPRISAAPSDAPEVTAGPDDLAYLIYTSGSTGQPKGVMVAHRNVINFYAGMAARVPTGPDDCWLALTSLSFDISVLEIFYTMARGARVVLVSEQDRLEASRGHLPISDGGMEFSLYYWGNDDGVGRDKYGLLLDGARFADAHGFCAVWTPERHFHAFGGPYPNPSVTGAAVAAVTSNIGVRAGSCVAPLHHTARIAEEWAVIDNLTDGRAGLAIASGWQPDDFVLRPENTPPENKPAMLRQIEDLRALWRGEEVAFPRKDGKMHGVVTQPRPVSRELPVWVTTAGNPATWVEAGKIGANVLTHLLGQSIDEVKGKIVLYHDALREAGHDPAGFTVTLMLHTCLADTRDAAREIAREPMKDYLRAAAGLIKQYAWAFPAFKRPEGVNNAFDLDLEGLSDDELDAILEFAFERYFTDSGLFGTVEDALERVEALKAIGVTEVACLIDYGIARETVLDGLRPLADVVARANAGAQLDPDDMSIAAQILRHGVSHMQCTPSMARLLLSDNETRAALRGLRQILLGGEALPGDLVRDLAETTDAPVENMYGPTETTIWSTTAQAQPGAATMPIGGPIANTQCYVLDEAMQPVPVGVEGELYIGGAGVTPGYWRQEALTETRFVQNPFGDGRLYRTGDLVRWQADGQLSFSGRVDGQIKLRGHRIELGEIEAALASQPGVDEAICVVRQDGDDPQLVGYVRGTAAPGDLRTSLMGVLPSYMVPSHVVSLEAFPLTPNRKIDRKALPAPQVALKEQRATAPRPTKMANPVMSQTPGRADVGGAVIAIWQDVLGVTGIQPTDNFFDLGGHSLLAVQTHRQLRAELGAPMLSIADVFGYPTVEGLAARISALHPDLDVPDAANDAPRPAAGATAGGTQADKRRDAIARRREMRARRAR